MAENSNNGIKAAYITAGAVIIAALIAGVFALIKPSPPTSPIIQTTNNHSKAVLCVSVVVTELGD